MLTDIHSDDLQTFVAVIDRGSLSAAVVHLGQTTSGVSRALARLKDKLQTSLLTCRMELTEEGQLFLDRARRILVPIEEVEEYIRIRRQQPAACAWMPALAASPAKRCATLRWLAKASHALPIS